MIDPRISLAVQTPNVGNAINIFENTLMNAQTRQHRQAQEARAQALAPFQQQQAQQNIDINQQTLDANRDKQRLTSLYNTSQFIKPMLLKNDVAGATKYMLNNISQLQERIEGGSGEDITESMETLAKLQSGDLQGVMGDIGAIEGLYNQGQKPQAKPASVQETEWFNAQTPEIQEAHLKVKRGDQLSQNEQLTHAQALADIDIAKTQKVETIKKTVSRTSDLKKEFSERRRMAARSTRKVKEAQKLAEKATQGLVGASKVQLGRMFPGIDTSNEMALVGAFKSLALDELQKFKGPTTDFEFRVTEDIAGSLGDGASANKARLASLERANWFADRESQQFNNHVKAGHDPDEFFFNFNELVTPKRGGNSYSLQDLQDTAVANHVSINEVIKRLSK